MGMGRINPLAPHEDGRKRFGGNCANLKQSQVYPQGYAEELHNVWKEEKEQVVDLADSSSDSDYPDVPLEQDSMWQDLNADELPALMDQRDNVMPLRA